MCFNCNLCFNSVLIDLILNLKTNIDEKLQKRAQRFGAISPKVKQMDVNEKLVKRAERFAISSNNNNNTTTTKTTDTEITGPQKRKITFDSGKETVIQLILSLNLFLIKFYFNFRTKNNNDWHVSENFCKFQ